MMWLGMEPRSHGPLANTLPTHSLTSRGLFLEEQKGCFKRSRGTGELLYIDQHILSESKTKRKNLAMTWINNTKHMIWFRNSRIVRNITWSHELYRENHQNEESAIDSRREKRSWSEDPKRYVPWRCIFTITIYNSDEAAQPHTQNMHNRIKTLKIIENEQSALKMALMHQYNDYYSHQKQYWQHAFQQNDNNQKTKMRRKTTLWTF